VTTVESPGSPAPLAGVRVLLVEDNPDTAESTALALRLHGHEVRVAGDGPTALVLAAAEPPDAALVDVGLPGMDGCEVARCLRELCLPRRPLLVAVTGYGAEAIVRRCYEAGIDMYFLKPADLGRLLGVLRRLHELKVRQAHPPAPTTPPSGPDSPNPYAAATAPLNCPP
jgi:CheY-like chemotaxis protein